MEFKREHQINLIYVLAAMIGVLVIQSLISQPDHIRTIPYSEFQQLASQGKVTDLVVGPIRITGTFKDAPKGTPQHFSTLRVDPALAQSLSSVKLTFSVEP